MNNLDRMLERNRDFVAQQAPVTLMPSLPRALPNVKAIIIGCADMRVDPAHIFGIKPGEAVVIRNIGGRITPGLLEQLGLLGRIGRGCWRDSWRGRGVSHHNSSAHRLRHDSPYGRPRHVGALFSNTRSGTEEKAVTDPHTAVAVDVAVLRAVPALPGQWLISGLVYDVATGLVEVVVPPAPLRSAYQRHDPVRRAG